MRRGSHKYRLLPSSLYKNNSDRIRELNLWVFLLSTLNLFLTFTIMNVRFHWHVEYYLNVLNFGHQQKELMSLTSSAAAKVLHAFYLTSGIQNSGNWCSLLRNYFSKGLFTECLLLYAHTLPNRTHQSLLPLVLKSSASLSFLSFGKSIHAEAIKSGHDSDIMVGTALVSMYLKCHRLSSARELFDQMPVRNVVTFNAMIGGYSESGDMDSAGNLFDQLSERTSVSWVSMIQGYAKIKNTDAARLIFNRVPLEMKTVAVWTAMVNGYAINGQMDAGRMIFDDMPCRNFFVWSSMVAGYFKKGDAKEGRATFDRIPCRNLVNWNVLINGYAQNGFCEEALKAFEEMQRDGFDPDEVSIASALSACAQLGDLNYGRNIHELIDLKRIKLNQFVLCGLVDMYAKCGDLDRARRVFEGMSQRNQACWNSMISGFSSHGRCEEALKLFKEMEAEEKPDAFTFLAVLSACTHGGLVKEGFEIFNQMKAYNLVPEIGHYGCLVDLLCRAGRLKEAYDLIKGMPFRPNEVVLGGFLGACRIHSDAQIAERVISEFKHVGFGSDLLLSNIYAASDRWEEAEKLRRRMYRNDVQKIPGCSLIV